MAGAGGRTPALTTLPPTQDSAQPAGHANGVAALISAHPWAHTRLGPRHRWDPTIRALLDAALASLIPMVLAYGDDFTLIYNDAYAALLGTKHPAAFGRPGAEALGELWARSDVGPIYERVYRTGQSFLQPEAQLPLTRGPDGRTEQVLFTRGHSAVRDSTGAVVGVLTVAAETTALTHRLQRLGELTSALAGALTLDDVARVALAYAVSSFDVDHAGLAVDDGGAWRAVRRVRGEILDDADERLPPLWRRLGADSPSPLVRVARSGRPQFTADGAPLRRVAADRHDKRVRALAALPLRTRSVRGAFSVGYREAHAWSPAEHALLNAATELIAQATERARQFEAQHGTAQLLQRSMLPENLPELERFRVAARYDVGLDGNAAGGDFYDAFTLPDGRLAVVLGDVAGHDVHAAALMGQVRAALRALALTDPSPSTVLGGLDRLVASLGAESRNEELFVTVAYGLLDPKDGTVTLASAGHPPPVLRRANGAEGQPPVHLLSVPTGPPLGVGGRWRTATTRLQPGDTLLLFSDGAVERRGRPLSDGLDALVTAVRTAPSGDPRNLCSLASAAVSEPTDDDVAVLAIEHAVTPSRSAAIVVPAEPTGPSRVRRWMTARLRAWSVPDSVISSAILCTSELTTNALLHAGTPAQVHIDLSAERLLVSVADTGTRGTVIRAHTDTLSGRGRGLGLIEELSDAWGTDPTVRGATVWFEMLLPAGQVPRTRTA